MHLPEIPGKQRTAFQGGRGARPVAMAGFTLVELLVVIALLAALIAILFPILGSARQSAQKAQCVSNLQQLGVAVHAYAMENNGTLPPFNKDVNGSRNWYLFLMYSNVAGLRGDGVLPNTNPGNARNALTVYNCPANPGRIGRWYYPNYAYNRSIGESRLANIDPQSQVILLVDGGSRGPIEQSLDVGPPSWTCYLTDYAGAAYGWERSVNFDCHHDKANILFVDSHIESLGRDDVKNRGGKGTLLWSRENKATNDAKRTNYW